MSNPFNFAPIAPERNPPINPQYYEPSRFVITGITEGLNSIVTTSLPHNYVIGQEIKLLIPPFWGAYQLNKQTGFVIAIPSSTQVTVTIDSIGANTFGLRSPAPQYPQQPQIIAIGDINSGLINSRITSSPSPTIPGAFRDISPN